MPNLKLKLRDKFFFLFASGTALVVFIAAIGIYGTRKGMEDIEKLYKETYNITDQIMHIKADIFDARVELVTMMLERNQEKNIRHKQRIDFLTADALTDYNVLMRDKILSIHTDTAEKLKQAKKAWDEFRDTRDNELIPLILQNKLEEARELAADLQQDRYNNIVKLFGEAISLEKGRLEKRHEEIERFGRNLFIVIAVIMAAGIGFGAFIFLFVSRDIVKRVNTLANAHKELLGGRFEQNLEVKGTDEISGLAAGFNIMARQLYEDRVEQEQYTKVLKWNAENNEKRSKELESKNKELLDLNKKLQETKSHLIQSEKMASVGQLAAGVAHEINNPMGFISSNFNTLTGYVAEMRELLNMYNWLDNALKDKDFDEAYKLWKDIDQFKNDIDLEFITEDIGKLVAESKDGIERVRTIVADLKNFSHKSEDEMKEFDVNKGLESTIHLVWNELKYKAEVKKEYSEVPNILCFPQQINQVFTNVIVNAAQAIPERGEIKIKTYTESFMHTNNGWAVVEIMDNGTGMTDEVKQNLFTPFFTTKPVGKGTGLGLSIAYGIIKKHNGTIDVESEAGKGTKFIIRLPVNEVTNNV